MKINHLIILISAFVVFAFLSNEDYKEQVKQEKIAKKLALQRKARAKVIREYNELAQRGYALTGFNSEMKK